MELGCFGKKAGGLETIKSINAGNLVPELGYEKGY